MFKLGQKPFYLVILACIQLVGIALFCKGFFPYKIYLPGYATQDDMPSSFSHNEPEFDRLVFVVIDALRNDFIIGQDSGFDFVNSQIQQGAAYPFTAKATAPTVTMPRIKALTTGTIPSFLDAILNIAESDTSSSLDFHDNWVYQFKKNGNKTIHFFGDDTWIRLFPGLFDKMDGTTSFFVSDTVEVDLNVTRHIKTDLVERDWDAVIFHYLGLDHIGHLGGPYSPLMKPKQKEMDQAIELIYNIVAKQDSERMIQDGNAKGTLIVVCGDHGMNEKGNHGGSSIGEISAALVFLSPRFESRPSIKKQQKLFVNENQETVLGYPIVDQIDLVPTLATLFSFAIPKNNLGKVIFNFYGSENVASNLASLQANAYQLGQLLSKLLPEVSKFIESPPSTSFHSEVDSPGRYYAEAIQLHEQYLTKATDQLAQETAAAYFKFIDVAQSYLANTASDYNINLMISGVLLISVSTLAFVVWAVQLVTAKEKALARIWNFSKYFSIFAMVGYSASMFASSFVEEEHATWYYLIQTITLLSIIHTLRLPYQSIREKFYPINLCITQLVLTRIAIAWSHGEVVSWILSYNAEAKWHLMALALLGALVAGLHNIFYKLELKHVIDVNQTAKIIQTIVKFALGLIMLLNSVLVLVYKMKAEGGTSCSCDGGGDATGASVPGMYCGLLDWDLVQPLDQVQLGRLIFNYGGAGLFVLAGLFYVMKRASLMIMGEANLPENKSSLFLQILLHLVTPILILLSGSQHAFMFLIFNAQLKLIFLWQEYLSEKSPVPTWLLSMLITCLSHAAFFLTSHTNSIASVDLSNAYVGVQDYDTVLIGLLTFCSNWSASLWWSIAGWALVENVNHKKNSQPVVVEKKEEEEEEVQSWFTFLITQSAVFGLALAFLSISVTILREHLFIWTVFSPKYLYQVAWTVLFHWLTQVVIGSAFTQILFKWNVTHITDITTAEDDEEQEDEEEEEQDELLDEDNEASETME